MSLCILAGLSGHHCCRWSCQPAEHRRMQSDSAAHAWRGCAGAGGVLFPVTCLVCGVRAHHPQADRCSQPQGATLQCCCCCCLPCLVHNSSPGRASDAAPTSGMTGMPAHVMKPHASTKPQAWWAACWSTCCPSDPGDRPKLPYLPVPQGCWQYLHQTCTQVCSARAWRMLRQQRSMQLPPGCHSRPCVPTMCDALHT